MYAWLWHHLPGRTPGKTVSAVLLLVGVLALLFFVVFPWAEPRLPFNDVTVSPGSSTPSRGPSPSP